MVRMLRVAQSFAVLCTVLRVIVSIVVCPTSYYGIEEGQTIQSSYGKGQTTNTDLQNTT